MKIKNFQYYISSFLSTYIGGERGLSENTVLSYNKTFKLLVSYLCENLQKSIDKVTMEEFDVKNIKGFLESLEAANCCVSTRNQRLAAIKSFCRFIQMDSPQYMFNMQQILGIRAKKGVSPIIQYLSAEQLSLLLAEPDYTTKYGFKDLVILTVLADSGVRVSELINIKVSDIRLSHPAQILICGKGKKYRWVPISSKTKDLIKLYMEKENLLSVIKKSEYLFLNRSKKPFTRAGITYILRKYTTQVYQKNPMNFPEKLSPHCLRHTKAMILLNAGENLIYIRDILGHEHMKTTEIYARTDNKQLRMAIETASVGIEIPNSTTIDYKNDTELLSWLLDYSN